MCELQRIELRRVHKLRAYTSVGVHVNVQESLQTGTNAYVCAYRGAYKWAIRNG